MGQYYYPVLLKKRGKKPEVLSRTINGDYMMGKLMEHSWVGNTLTDYISSIIYENPTRIAWVGDYFDEFLEKHKEESFLEEHPEQLKNMLSAYTMADSNDWLECSEKKKEEHLLKVSNLLGINKSDLEKYKTSKFRNVNANVKEFVYSGKYLINHDNKVGFSLDSFQPKNNEEWIIYPISLLTAVGNGCGGGDYWKENINIEDVGCWAGCLLEIVDEMPQDCKEIEPAYFKEN